MPNIEIHYTMPTEKDPLVVQPLKVPKSVLESFRLMAELEGRSIQWMLRNEITGAAKKFNVTLEALRKKATSKKK
jgi:hypothetical protein